MTIEDAMALKPGDMVLSPLWQGKPAQEVESVNRDHFPVDPVVFFKNGGFWKSSQLFRATHATAAKGVTK